MAKVETLPDTKHHARRPFLQLDRDTCPAIKYNGLREACMCLNPSYLARPLSTEFFDESKSTFWAKTQLHNSISKSSHFYAATVCCLRTLRGGHNGRPYFCSDIDSSTWTALADAETLEPEVSAHFRERTDVSSRTRCSTPCVQSGSSLPSQSWSLH